jgi:hypothetical protein
MAGESMTWRKACLMLISVLAASCAPGTNDVPDDVETQVSAVVLPSVKVEAEAMTLSGYAIAADATASGGRIVRTTSTGRATTTFSGAAGTYDIVVTYIDAPGGSARFTLTVNGATRGTWVADQEVGRTSISVSGVALTSGAQVRITGVANLSDRAGLDMIEFAQAVQTTPTFTKNRLFAANDLFDVAYGNGRFMAVGNDSAVKTSPDGLTWTTQTSAPVGAISADTYRSGFFILVSSTGGSNSIYKSSDGVSWTLINASAPEGRRLRVINNKFFLFGGGPTISTSADAVTWTTSDLPINTFFGFSWDQPALAFGNGHYVTNACVDCSDEDEGHIASWSSPDGVVWTEDETGSFWPMEDIVFQGGTFVSIPFPGTFNNIAFSTDGLDWTEIAPPTEPSPYAALIYNSGFRAFTQTGHILSSVNGRDWTTLATADVATQITRAAANSTRYVAVGVGGQILRTTDLRTWSERVPDNSYEPTGTAFGGGKLVLAGQHTFYVSSDNGATFTKVDIAASKVLGAVRFFNGAFFAPANAADGSSGALLRSTDGANWTTVLSAASPINDVAFGNGRYVATPHWVSTNGTTWTMTSAVFLPGLDPGPVVFGNGTFLAESSGQSYRSTDGSNWTVGTAISEGNNALAFGLGQFAMVTFGSVFTSYDGQVWNRRQTYDFAALPNVAFVNGRFFATEDRNVVLTSENGITWKPCPTDSINAFRAVTFGNATYFMAATSRTVLTAH